MQVVEKEMAFGLGRGIEKVCGFGELLEGFVLRKIYYYGQGYGQLLGKWINVFVLGGVVRGDRISVLGGRGDDYLVYCVQFGRIVDG